MGRASFYGFLAQHGPELFRDADSGGFYCAEICKATAEVDWDDAAFREAFLTAILRDGERALALAREARSSPAAGSGEDQRIVAAAALLTQLPWQDVERTEAGYRSQQGTAKDRVPSVHDPEQRHGRKSHGKTFTGPKGAVAVTPGGGQPKVFVKRFHFPQDLCRACSRHTDCVTDKEARGRTITGHPDEERVQAARAFEQTDYFREQYRKRVVVEHRIAGRVQLGIRQSRFCGRKRTAFQLLMAVTVANLTLVGARRPRKVFFVTFSAASKPSRSGFAYWAVSRTRGDDFRSQPLFQPPAPRPLYGAQIR